VRKALSYPARQIANQRREDGSVVVGKILEKDQYSWGFDSQTGEYANLISKGIIDPTKVVRVAIQNAASVAALLITTEAMVAEVPKKNTGAGAADASGRRHGRHGFLSPALRQRQQMQTPAAMPGFFACCQFSNSVVIPGRATWRGPGIHTPDGGYGFRARRCASPRNDEQ